MALTKIKIGDKFGRLTVIDFAGHERSKNGQSKLLVKCRCDHGGNTNIPPHIGIYRACNLTRGDTKSCGCLKIEKQNTVPIGNKYGETHGYSNEKLYAKFTGMKQRCYNPNTDRYKNYGGRGIGICNDWLQNPNNFYKWAYENGYHFGMSIERKDINKGYSPENCTFIPMEDQSKNRTDTHMISLNGKTQCLADWCRELNLNYNATLNRVWRHMTVDEILFLPPNYHRLKTLDAISFVPEESRDGFDYIKDFEERQRRF